MRFEDDINTMIEWGKEEKQPDYVEFVEFLRDRHADKKPVVVEQDGGETEFVIYDIIFLYRKPFPDFDLSVQYLIDEKTKKRAKFNWNYAYMHMFKKIGKDAFSITTEYGKVSTIRCK